MMKTPLSSLGASSRLCRAHYIAPGLALLAALLGPALGAAAERPEWLSGSSPEYPKAAYLLGIGRDAVPEKAADMARAEISKSFSLSITALTRSSARERSGGDSSSYAEEISEEVMTATARILDGVEIASYWQDPQGTTHSLAVLNREQARLILTDKIAEMDVEFQRITEGLALSSGKFERLRLALRLVELAASRRNLSSDYRVLSPEGRGIPESYAPGAILRIARQAISSVTVSIEAEGNSPEQVALWLSKDLARHGLRVRIGATSKGAEADLLVQVRSSGEIYPPENLLWVWSKARVEVALVYGANGESAQQFEETSSQRSPDPSSALKLALHTSTSRAAQRLFQYIQSGQLYDP